VCNKANLREESPPVFEALQSSTHPNDCQRNVQVAGFNHVTRGDKQDVFIEIFKYFSVLSVSLAFPVVMLVSCVNENRMDILEPDEKLDKMPGKD